MRVTAARPHEYYHIEAWQRHAGTSPAYHLEQQRLAAKAQVPTNAVYYSHWDERWVFSDEIVSSALRRTIDEVAATLATCSSVPTAAGLPRGR